ncbi:MAG: HEAT repeat domain-containing protein [Acidobacteriota bacterium]
MSFQKSLPVILALLLAASAAPATAQHQPFLTASLASDDATAAGSDTTYRLGRQALDQNRWADAARLFAESAASRAGHADAAHYWWAYALHKDGRGDEAMEVLDTLRNTYEDSRWLDDATALQLEIKKPRSGRSSRRGDSASGGTGGSEDDNELKLLALNALMHNHAERALPMLERFLAGDHPVELRQRALFVLSQNESAEAGRILLDVARGTQHPELQMRALHYLGLSELPNAISALQEIYRTSSNREVKSKVLNSFMLAEAVEPVLELARTEPDPELRGHAIHQLGVMEAHDELRELYRTESSKELKGRILHSMFIAEDTDTLIDIARTDPDQEMRRKAIRSLGLVDSKAANQALGDIYRSTSDGDTRKAIIQAFFLSDDVEQLIEIARTETSVDLRKHAIQQLSLMDDDRALDFMIEILEQ